MVSIDRSISTCITCLMKRYAFRATGIGFRLSGSFSRGFRGLGGFLDTEAYTNAPIHIGRELGAGIDFGAV